MKLTFALCALLLAGAATINAADKPKMDPAAVFAKKDANGDGKLDKAEFTKGSKDAAKSAAQFDKMQKDGFITKEAFVAGAAKKKAK